MFTPQSPEGLAISNLFNFVLILSALVFLLVAGLVVYNIIRFRHREGQPDPPPRSGNRKLEIGWTLGAFLLLALIFAFSVQAMGEANPPSNGKQPDIEVIGHQWWWEVRYPSAGVVTANEIHIPVGKDVLFRLSSADVIHNLWFPELGRKMDLTPNFPTSVYLRADKPGTYNGACGEFCGEEHSRMLVYAMADTPDAFNKWLADQKAPAVRPGGGTGAAGSGNLANGLQIFQQKTCISCHNINGITPSVSVGPDLTHVGSRTTLAAGTLQNNMQDMKAWLKDPQSIKPGVKMPNVQLTDAEVQDLAAFLESLK